MPEQHMLKLTKCEWKQGCLGRGHTIDVSQTSVEIDGGNRIEGSVCSLYGSGEDMAIFEVDGVWKGGLLEGHGYG